MEQLTLSASEFTVSDSTVTWYWRLVRSSGNVWVNDFQPRIDRTEWEYLALTDLYGWLDHNCARNEDWLACQERTVTAVGEWITARVLGPLAADLHDARPCAVRVVASGAAADIAYMPIELARVGGKPLALHNVSFVIDTGGSQQAGPTSVTGAQLRVLGLFSLPEGAGSLNLRKERRALESLAGLLAGMGRDVRLMTLQYGTTREALEEALKDGDGWDVVHLSGHGRAGRFLLEKVDGTRDPISGAGLVELLTPLRNRVCLLTLSSCESAETVGRAQLALLAAPADPAVGRGSGDGADPGHGADPWVGSGEPALAVELARHLRCAVLGMRYPVAEPFAADFAYEVYRLMFDKGMPLARARAVALASVASPPATAERPALSVGVPALYGPSALSMRLTAPAEDKGPVYGHETTKLAAVPHQPAHFVGRVRAMARAAKVLAPESGLSALVIEGMMGIGKSALAEELVYTRNGNFWALVWHRFEAGVPGLPGLTTALQSKISKLDLAPFLGTEAQARACAADQARFFQNRRVLVVLDHVDAQLSPVGQWGDERLGLLVGALADHGGQGKVIMTTRRPVAGLASATAHREHLEPLSRSETLLLASELARLRTLLAGTRPTLNAESARSLARGVLNACRGHPGLLCAAEDRAGDPADLLRMVLAARRIWAQHGTGPETEAAYLAVLSAWTDTSSGGAH